MEIRYLKFPELDIPEIRHQQFPEIKYVYFTESFRQIP